MSELVPDGWINGTIGTHVEKMHHGEPHPIDANTIIIVPEYLRSKCLF